MDARPSLFQLFVGTVIYKMPYRESRRCLDLIANHGLPVTYLELSAHHLAGGRIGSWIEGLIYAQNHGIKMSVTNAAARDLIEVYGSKLTLLNHIQAFERLGVKDLDSAPLDLDKIKEV